VYNFSLTRRSSPRAIVATNFMASQKDSISGIEIKPGQITIAQYFPRENSVGSVIIKPLGVNDPREFDAVLKSEFKDLVGEIDFKNQNVALALPSEFSTIKKFSLDSDEKDPAQALRWEIGQHLIGPIEDYSFDFEPLANGDGPATKQYLVAAYRSSSMQKLVSLLKANKLNPLVVGLDIFGLINTFEANYPEETAHSSVLILGADKSSVIVVTANGGLADFEVFQHETGPQPPDDYGARVAEFVGRAGVAGALPPKAYCAGTLFSQPDFIDSLAGKLGGAQLLDPFKSIACRAGKGEEELRKFSHQLAVAVGMALQGGSEI
jgi:Tfp pilus assembly PilM family ATPase